MSRKFGIVALVLLAAFVPLSVLGNGEGDEATEENGAKPLWGFRWFRGFGCSNGERTVEETVEDMAERLGLTDDEIAEVTPIAQEIADLREQLKAKMEELHEVIGPKVEAYRESKMGEMPGRFRGMRGRRGGRCFPCQDASEDADAGESE